MAHKKTYRNLCFQKEFLNTTNMAFMLAAEGGKLFVVSADFGNVFLERAYTHAQTVNVEQHFSF